MVIAALPFPATCHGGLLFLGGSMGKFRVWVLSRFWWVGFLWYGLTRLFGKGPEVKVADTPEEIATRLGHGDRYRADRRADTMRAPRVIQARIDSGWAIGDCDEHAGYSAAALDKSRLTWRAYLGQVHGTKDGRPAGHLFAAWQDDRGDWWVLDYSVRGPFGLPRTAIEEIARGVGILPRVGAWVRVHCTDRDRLAHEWRDSGALTWPVS